MGVDAAELNETIDPATGYRVTATAGALPWERAIPTIKKAALEIYAVLNGTLKICPTSMEGWFQGYTALTSFDGTNFDTSLLTSNTASLDNLFNGWHGAAHPEPDQLELAGNGREPRRHVQGSELHHQDHPRNGRCA